MSSIDFEYAIKKDVRNNPIVREVDQERQRQLWRSLAIGPGSARAATRCAAGCSSTARATAAGSGARWRSAAIG